MDFSRPASADPPKLVAAANDWRVTQAFASPAVWRLVGKYCERSGASIPSLVQVFSCGAPVPAGVIRKTLACVAPGAKMHTPYGATECLPVATIEAEEVLDETAAKTDLGAGVCVGRKFDSIDWRVIRITNEAIATLEDAEELPRGEIGELIVRGPQTSPCYVTRREHNATAKIYNKRDGVCWPAPTGGISLGGADAPTHNEALREYQNWHRMGDVGYLDAEGRFWYCGRKSHRVVAADQPLYTECIEAIFNTHPDVVRCALVGLGEAGAQIPVIFFEPHIASSRVSAEVVEELRQMAPRHAHTRAIQYFIEFPKLPVDLRHNAKILREELTAFGNRIGLVGLHGHKS
jgi:acyl-coenzyme A synthetase/AMP-(fatty) acid ligase